MGIKEIVRGILEGSFSAYLCTPSLKKVMMRSGSRPALSQCRSYTSASVMQLGSSCTMRACGHSDTMIGAYSCRFRRRASGCLRSSQFADLHASATLSLTSKDISACAWRRSALSPQWPIQEGVCTTLASVECSCTPVDAHDTSI